MVSCNNKESFLKRKKRKRWVGERVRNGKQTGDKVKVMMEVVVVVKMVRLGKFFEFTARKVRQGASAARKKRRRGERREGGGKGLCTARRAHRTCERA